MFALCAYAWLGVSRVDWITPTISGAAGVIGASVGILGNIITSRNQWRLTNQADVQAAIAAKFRAYNEVLNINGREPILTPGKGLGWNPDLYIRYIRPVLFENFHLLDDRVRMQVRTIDNQLQLRRWHLVSEEDVPDASEYMFYFELISLIENEYGAQAKTCPPLAK